MKAIENFIVEATNQFGSEAVITVDQAKKVLKAPEVKKVASKSKPTSKQPKDDKENLGDNRDE